MEHILLYLLRSSVYLFVFSTIYFLFFRTPRNIRFNRFYILSAFIFSLALGGVSDVSISPLFSLQERESIVVLPEVLVVASSNVPTVSGQISSSVSGYQPGNYLLAGVVLILALQLCVRITKLFGVIRQSPREKIQNLTLVMLTDKQSPFSFFHWIFIPDTLRNTPDFDKVFSHEKAHHDCRHSWDVLFLQAMKLLFWYHPAWYFFNHHLKNLHEYEADRYALVQFSKPAYQQTLLNFSLGHVYMPVTNPFNVSTLKKRFMMMSQKNKLSFKRLLVSILSLSLMLGTAFFLQSCNVTESDHAEGTDLEPVTEDIKSDQKEYDKIFTIVEENPEFPGGMDQFMAFLTDNLSYPRLGKDAGVEGTLFLTFVVGEDGELGNIEILRGMRSENTTIDDDTFRKIAEEWDTYNLDYPVPTHEAELHHIINEQFDKEGLRVMALMPDWEPGYQRGEPVNVQFNVPLRFVLN